MVELNAKQIVNSGALASYVELLHARDSDRQESESRTPEVEEQNAAARGLWILGSTCPDQVRSEPRCVEGNDGPLGSFVDLRSLVGELLRF